LKKESARHNIEDLLGLGSSYQASQLLFEAVRIGVFDALYDRGQTIHVLSEQLCLSPGSCARFVRALKEMGLVKIERELCKNSAMAQKYLCTKGKQYLGDFFIHRETLREPWSALAYSLKHEKMVMPGKNRLACYPRQLQKFTRAMDALGRLKSEHIQKKASVGGFRAMLDLGGGIGTYAVSFCRSNPLLQATVFDLNDVVRQGRSHIKKAGLAGRITLQAGQCLSDPLPEGPFDLVFISNLIHIYKRADCEKIINRAAAVLQRRGTLMMHDYMFGCGDPVAVALFDLTMLVGTPGGRCYERKEIESMMRKAGIKNIKAFDVLAGTSVVMGAKG